MAKVYTETQLDVARALESEAETAAMMTEKSTGLADAIRTAEGER